MRLVWAGLIALALWGAFSLGQHWIEIRVDIFNHGGPLL